MKRLLKAIGAVLAAVAVLLLGFLGYYYLRPDPPQDQVTWGITFSQTMSQQLGENWQEAYLAILDDLKPAGLRLVVYWNLTEPKKDSYDFTDLDWQVGQASDRHIPVILTVGQKVPRWPECYVPDWASGSEKNADLLQYVQTAVEHYRDNPELRDWQLENEPYLTFGSCAKPDPALIRQERDLIRRLDPAHPILMTDGGEWGSWYPAASQADLFGTTMYRQVYSEKLGRQTTYALPPQYYQAKAEVIRLLTGKPRLQVIVSELGLEPWGDKQVYSMTLAEQEEYLPPQTFARNIAYAKDAGFTTYYLWGAEWWYQAKQRGQPAYWSQVRDVIATGKRP